MSWALLLVVSLHAHAQDVARGEVLAGLAGCAACHVSPDGVAYAGGYAIETRFGTFHGPNITQDPTHGIGAWTEADFVRAMREGHAPDGHAYWPAFPYPWFTNAPADQLADLWAYLRTIPPDGRANTPNDIKPLYRPSLGLWRSIAFREGPLDLPDDTPADVAQGALLVEGLGHCAGCHTPRSATGTSIQRRAFAGTDDPPEKAPNITPHEEDGIGGWSTSDLRAFLETGMTGEGDFVGGHMKRIVDEGTSRLAPDERDAIVAYLRSLKPVADR